MQKYHKFTLYECGELIEASSTCELCCRCLPREVDPLVYNMTHEDPGDVKYSDVGGLGEQIRELREV